MTEHWIYECSLVNEATGERRNIVVTLTDDERSDALRHLLTRGEGGPGGPDGPIVKGYALRHAAAKAPAGFVPTLEVWRRPDLAIVH